MDLPVLPACLSCSVPVLPVLLGPCLACLARSGPNKQASRQALYSRNFFDFLRVGPYLHPTRGLLKQVGKDISLPHA